MQILEYEQHRDGSGALGEQCERRLEDQQLRPSRRVVDPARIAERPQGIHERLERELRADKIDGAPDEDLEPSVTGTSRQLCCEPTLADSCISGEDDGRTAPSLSCGERALERCELACSSDEDVALASLHSGQYRAVSVNRESARKQPSHERRQAHGER